MIELVHFIVTTIKVVLLSAAYVGVLLFVISLLARRSDKRLMSRVLNNRPKLWFYGSFFTAIMLFTFSRSHWGDHGYGDFGRIPMAHGKAVLNSDQNSFIMPEGTGERVVGLSHFVILDNHLAGLVVNTPRHAGNYLVWELETNRITFYDTTEQLRVEGRTISKRDMSSFEDVYADYWNGWRFWLLP